MPNPLERINNDLYLKLDASHPRLDEFFYPIDDRLDDFPNQVPDKLENLPNNLDFQNHGLDVGLDDENDYLEDELDNLPNAHENRLERLGVFMPKLGDCLDYRVNDVFDELHDGVNRITEPLALAIEQSDTLNCKPDGSSPRSKS